MPDPEEEELKTGELDDAAALALLTSDPAPSTEPTTDTTTETPPAPSTEPTPAPENRDELPEWLASIKPEDRAAVANRFLETLSDQERAQLPSVNQLVNNAANYAAQQTQQALANDQNEDARTAELVDQANGLYDDIVNQALTADELTERLSGYADVAADTRQSELNEDIQESIWASARMLGLREIPGDVANKAAQADGWGGAVQVYNQYFLGTAYNAGIEAGKRQIGNAAKADTAADRARLRDEVIAELRAEGRIRDDVPPVLGNSSGVGRGRVVIDDNASEEELLAAAGMNLQQMRAAGSR